MEAYRASGLHSELGPELKIIKARECRKPNVMHNRKERELDGEENSRRSLPRSGKTVHTRAGPRNKKEKHRVPAFIGFLKCMTWKEDDKNEWLNLH